MLPLWRLCSLGQIEEVRVALNRGEDVNSQNAKNQTALMFAAGGPSKNDVSILKLLLEQPWIMVNLEDCEGLTALHRAIDCGNIEAVKLLLANQRVDVNCKDGNQRTPLILASGKAKDFDMFKLLLADQRVDVNAVASDPTIREVTALVCATLTSNVKATKLLLDDQRVDVNWMNSYGISPLYMAMTSEGDIKLLEMFLSHPRMDVNSKHGPAGKTLLHVAAQTNNVEAAKLILAEPRFTSANAQAEMKGPAGGPNCGYWEGAAVIIAANKGHREVLKELVSHPSIDLGVKDKNGLSLDDLIR